MSQTDEQHELQELRAYKENAERTASLRPHLEKIRPDMRDWAAGVVSQRMQGTDDRAAAEAVAAVLKEAPAMAYVPPKATPTAPTTIGGIIASHLKRQAGIEE